MKINLNIIKKYIDDGLLMYNKHPMLDLYIYNYTKKVQYEKLWDSVTLQCRGLILDGEGNVAARPFKKFFNIEEHDESEIPNLPFKVYEKMDGSLGVMYFIDGIPFIASRGSFDSEYSRKANKILNEKYSAFFGNLNPNYTYLFEIIYPENRIVVDYGDMEDIVLTGIIDIETGNEMPLQLKGFNVVKEYECTDFKQLKELNVKNKEGFVVKFSNDFRMKIKFEDYIQLHSVLTNITNYDIWEYLSENKDLNEILDVVPDETYDWIKNEVNQLQENFFKIEKECKDLFIDLGDRKRNAEVYRKTKYADILFLMLDSRDYSSQIWRRIKPEFRKVFTQ